MKDAEDMPAAKKQNDPQKNDPKQPELDLSDWPLLGKILIDVSQRTEPLLKNFFEKYEFNMAETQRDPMHLRPAYMEFLSHLWSNPQKLFEMQAHFWQDYAHLCQESALRFMGGDSQALYKPEKGDRRFRSDLWQESALFDFIKQSYLLTSKCLQDTVEQTEGLDDDTRRKVDFYMRQFVSAMAPGNFVLTNPEVLQETLNSKGENLIRGLENLLEDMERGHGTLDISTTDYDAFELGENIATTPGKVIYQNDLMQLIQYEPSTDQVYKRPLLVIPPWINKYYILDLRPDNSLIKWTIEQGHTVFVISWVNPDKHLTKKRFEDYMEEGVLDAMEQVKKATGEPDCNLLGYCLGGTLLAITLAWLAAKKQQDRVTSATFLTSLVDFEEAGEMKLFMDDSQLALLDKKMAEKGILSGDVMKQTFSLLRANDLIWSFVINNYLMGREPFPFDLLYWNDDATNMPAAMHSFYLRKLYRDNLLAQPGGVTMKKTPIDMRVVKTPCYFLSTKEDHIAPWKATYATTQMLKGPVSFTLAASGHVAGVINPPDKKKYCYWHADKTPGAPDEWLEQTKQYEGSWWPHWCSWLKKHAGPEVPPRTPGEGPLKPIEEAPGSYVKMKAH